jgi:hypothetical protein
MMLSVVILLLTVTYVECHVLFIAITSVNMLRAIVLSVVVQNGITLSIVGPWWLLSNDHFLHYNKYEV